MLVDHGFDRVAFLHLGATQPREVGNTNPWIQAADDATEAEGRLQPVYEPSEMPTCGYFTAVMGSVAFAREDSAGAGGMLRTPQLCSPNLSRCREWRSGLQRRLAGLPRPTSPNVYICVCPHCSRQFLQTSSSVPVCDCHTSQGAAGDGQSAFAQFVNVV